MATESQVVRERMEEGVEGEQAPMRVPGDPEMTAKVQSLQVGHGQLPAEKATGIAEFLGEENSNIQLEEPVSGVTIEDIETPVDTRPPETPKTASEKAFYASSVQFGSTNPDRAINSYQKIKTDLETTGVSEDLTAITTLLESESSENTKAAILNIVQDENIPVERRSAILQQYLLERKTGISLSEEYAERTFAERPEETPAQLSNKEFDLSFFDKRLETNKLIQADVNKQIGRLDDSFTNFIGGFLELLVPFLDGVGTQIAKEAAFGEDGWFDRIYNTILAGEAKVDFRAALDRMPAEQRVEAVKRATAALANLPGADLPKLYLIEDLVGSPEYPTWQRGIDDFVGVLDTTLVGGAAFKLIKTGAKPLLKVAPTSPLGVTKVADPAKADELAAATLVDETGELAEVVGATKEEIIADLALPKHLDTALDDASSTVVDRMEEINKTLSDISEATATHGFNYTDVEKRVVKEKIQKSLEDVSGLKLHLSKSHIIDDGERYAGTVLYGRTTENGFKTQKGALNSAERNGISSDELVLFGVDSETGRLTKEITKDTNEFFVGKKFNHVYSAEDAGIHGSDVVSKLGRFKGAGFLLDIVSRFDGFVSTSFLRSKDIGSAVETRLLDIIRKDIRKLSNKNKLNVFKALEDGSAQGEIFSTAILKNTYKMSDKEIQAYYTYRKVSDVMWSLTNRSYRQSLKTKGMSSVISKGSDESYVAKPIKDRGSVSNNYVFDPEAGDIKRLSSKEIDELYESGGSIGTLHNRVSVGDSKATQILVRGDNTNFTALTRTPLKYNKGYYQRTYQEYFYVDRIANKVILDGVTITGKAERAALGNTIEAYSSRSAAEAAAKQLSEDTGLEHLVRLGKEFDVDPLVKDHQIYQGNLRTTKKRGERLVGAGDEGLAAIEDPIESLLRTVRTVSNHTSMADVIEATKQRWINTYSHLVKGEDFPASVADIDRSLAKSAEEYGNAVALRQLMDTVNNVPAKTDVAWQGFMHGVADMLEPASTGVAKVARDVGGQPITTAIRKLPSHFYIAMRPLRQVLIQSGQLMQYVFLEPKYLISGRAAKEMAAINMAAVSKGRSWEDAGMALAAKTWGVDKKEFDIIVDTYFNKSGLPYSVDANWFVEGIVKDIHETTLKSPLRKAAGVPKELYRKTVSAGKRVGFDVGEFENLTGSWLLAKRRWEKANPEIASKWHEKQYSDVIAGEARKIQYAMTQPGTFSYQRGILSIPMQFLAVPHKALLSMTTSKAWTPKDKAKIFAANAVLFGGYGLGLNETFDLLQEKMGFDVDDKTLQTIKGGVVDLAFNTMLHALFDEEGEDPTKINFSKSFAPLSEGLVPHDVFANFFNGDWVKGLLGPSYNILHFQKGRVAQAITDISNITRRGDIDTTEKALRFLDTGARIASGYSDYVKYRYAMKHDQLISQRGAELGINPTKSEALAKLFGFELTEEHEVYSLLGKFRDEKKELEAAFQKYYESQLRIWRTYGDTDPMLARELSLKESEIKKVFEPHEIQQLERFIVRMDRQSMTTVGDSLATLIAKDALAGGEIRELMVNRINGSQLSLEQKQIFKDNINEGFDEDIF